MKKLGLTILVFLIFYTSLRAQQTYRTALGIRVNGGAGITAKHFLSDDRAVEGILYFRWGGFVVTGLYQVHYPVFKEPGFRFYWGAGAHIGFWDDWKGNPHFDENQDVGAVIGVDGQAGLEYTFAKIPLNLSLDWKPQINFINDGGIWADDLGLSVRYTIK